MCPSLSQLEKRRRRRIPGPGLGAPSHPRPRRGNVGTRAEPREVNDDVCRRGATGHPGDLSPGTEPLLGIVFRVVFDR